MTPEAEGRPSPFNDRLYALLPVVYRQRDLEVGWPLRRLLSIVADQVDLLEDDIAGLYENWFIETCEDWVVPYIGALIGAAPAGSVEPSLGACPPRRQEVANAIRFRRRKGSLRVLEDLAQAVTGWPAHAVEYGRRLGQTQPLDHQARRRHGTVDIRSADDLDRIAGPFDTTIHSIDLRGTASDRAFGAFAIDAAAVTVWRLPVFSATRSTAYCVEEAGGHRYTFSILGNDGPLYTLPDREAALEDAGELALPVPIRRSALAERVRVDGVERVAASRRYYGPGRSLAIWVGAGSAEPLDAAKVIPADLSDWRFQPPRGHVAVDPELGRLVLSPSGQSDPDVFVTYHYACAAAIGGGEYPRALDVADDARIYRVGSGAEAEFSRIGDAYRRWQVDGGYHGVIELRDNAVYAEPLALAIGSGRTLEIRAAVGRRPVIALLDWRAGHPDPLLIAGEGGCRLVLDGLVVTGRNVELQGGFDRVAIRHCTLVPGWTVHPDPKRRRNAEPALSLLNVSGHLEIAHTVVGAIRAVQDDAAADPLALRIDDSIVDAAGDLVPAIGPSEGAVAPVTLTVRNTTVLGRVMAHAIERAENSIFTDPVRVARRQVGCIRYCYVAPQSRTPARFSCQPDLAEAALWDGTETEHETERLPHALRHELRRAEQLRVAPCFVSTRYGEPDYGRLALTCAEEIRRGADDRSELGVFHDRFEGPRAADLSARLRDFVPAGMEVGIVFAS